MIPYWIIFVLAASFALGAPAKSAKSSAGLLCFGLYAVLVALMIGFRWNVGGDWGWNIHRMIDHRYFSLPEFMGSIDPGYGVLMWLTANSGYNVWLLNLIGGTLFAYGLTKFCLNETHPWLAMTVAVPYLVIVVAMGYDRQAVAVGFVMLAMVALQDSSLKRFVGNMILATSMHITSLSLMPLFIFGSRINKFLALAIGGPVFAVGYIYLLHDKADDAFQSYLGTGYSSSGATIRITMNAVPAAVYFLSRKKFALSDNQRIFADLLSAIAMLLVVFLILSPSSTAVDRMALYIIPLQLFVLGRLPSALAHSQGEYKLAALGVVAYSAAVMLVWLNFAENAASWVPYSLIDSDHLVGLSY